MRVVLFASSDFAVPLLEGLHTSLHKIVAVYTQPPRLSGRGLHLKYESVGQRAQELSIKLLHPEVINEPKQLKYFSGLNVDVAIVAAYGQILSLDLLNIPRFGFLNLHPSLLPRWRGAAPIERALMAGDLNTGVCTIRMVKELDAGPILAQQGVPIGPETTAQSLSILLSQIGAVQVISTLDRITEMSEIPQGRSGITYAHKIMKREARINWENPAKVVDRVIRGLSPSPGAWCMLNGTRIKILNSKVIDAEGSPGCRINSEEEGAPLIIACGARAILITSIQREGKKPTSGEEFTRGYRGKINFK